MPLHVYDQGITLSECLRTKAALELLDVKMDLPMALESLRVQETFAAALPLALVRPLPCVVHEVPLQVVLVLALLATGWADNLLCSTF